VAAHEVLHTRPDVREPEGAAGRRAAVPPAAPKEAAGPRPDRRPEPPQAADPDRGSVPPAAVQANARAGGGAAPANSHSREVSTALSRSAALALVDLLHREIERHKRYPLIARRERREGTATVSFNLHPDGEVDGVAVDHSSGFGPLDRAAVYAVNGVAPFQPAGRFLSSVRRFRVNVVFRLY